MDTFVRYFHILSLLKPYPRRLSVADIKAALDNAGAGERGVRTIQRDLEKLSAHFPIDGDQRRPQGWCWSKDAPVLLPGMDIHTALTFRLMEEFMQPLIPTACLNAADRHFAEAGKVLRKNGPGRHLAWLDKIQIISRGQPLIPPTIKQEVLDTVYEALFSDRRFTATYRRREGGELLSCKVNPLGLVFINKSIYLVCTLWEYDDIKQMPLHRFEEATLLDTPAREIPDFSLDQYVKEKKEFDYPVGSSSIKLVASFAPEAAHHLRETPLSEDQQIEKKSEEEVIVTATVADTAQLRWWLLGFGDQVEVLSPKTLRHEMTETTKGMAGKYL